MDQAASGQTATGGSGRQGIRAQIVAVEPEPPRLIGPPTSTHAPVGRQRRQVRQALQADPVFPVERQRHRVPAVHTAVRAERVGAQRTAHPEPARLEQPLHSVEGEPGLVQTPPASSSRTPACPTGSPIRSRG